MQEKNEQQTEETTHTHRLWIVQVRPNQTIETFGGTRIKNCGTEKVHLKVWTPKDQEPK